MNYRTLPPGRQRMLAYSNQLLSRRPQLIRINRVQRSFDDIVISLINRRINFSPIITTHLSYNTGFDRLNMSYQNLSNLEDVKIGLISKNLFKNSTIKLSKEINFCAICQDDIDISSIIRKIKCNHCFHINCIDEWLTQNKKCPLCKFEI